MRFAAWLSLAVCLLAFVDASTAQAWHHRPRNSCEIGGYAPSTPRYVVVAPVGERGPIAFGPTPQGTQCGPTWPAAGLPAPTYPWGWFGAQTTFERRTHHPVYDDYFQVSRVRGY